MADAEVFTRAEIISGEIKGTKFVRLSDYEQAVDGCQRLLGDREEAAASTCDEDCETCTHRAVEVDGWWRAEYRPSKDTPWIRLNQRISSRIGRADTELVAWAAREGALQTTERTADGC